ncbi:hypothetical protein JAO76_12470 [Pontibacter sp. BT310]|uniref:Uncharacterized protein n=2 Tax=Pontibacter populi TaxID=890055 RepID=A0ABS6XD82_9BACT|nr:hypothetical protein [Pontibacter sp. BT310]MBJ6119013.1 hypothetical protein [Pontibacter sp. BT310]MBR0571441.1 hypothetical protein [Microvirga sp. STS03]MBW3365867.1 hypothetical protein [Pontibacter populi]
MEQTYYINPEKLIKVVNRMDNLKFAGLEVSDGSHIVIDIELEGIDPEAKVAGYTFVKRKQFIAAEVLEKAKIRFSRTSADIVEANLLRLTIYPPKNIVFGIE